MEALLKTGIYINTYNETKYNPLISVARAGYLSCVKLLFKKKINILLTNFRRMTALHEVAYNNYTRTMGVILNSKAPIALKNNMDAARFI